VLSYVHDATRPPRDHAHHAHHAARRNENDRDERRDTNFQYLYWVTNMLAACKDLLAYLPSRKLRKETSLYKILRRDEVSLSILTEVVDLWWVFTPLAGRVS
jgi:hypothetical protein